MACYKTLLAVSILSVLLGCSRDPEVMKQKLVATGNKYFDNGKYRAASIIYRRAIQKDGRFGEAYYRLGLAELKLGRTRGALAALTRANELQPENQDAFAKLADLYLEIYFSGPRRSEEWLADLNRLTERAQKYFPDAFDVNRVAGYVALTRQEYARAVSKFQAAASQEPDDQRAAIGLVQSLNGAGRFEEAESRARDFIAKHKSFGPMYDFLYSAYFTAGRVSDALEILKSKCENNPEQIIYWLQLASYYVGVGNRPEMLAVLERLTGNPEDFPTAYEEVGDFFTRIRDFDRALQTYEEGVKARPEQAARLKGKMVETLAAQGKREEAYQLVEQLLGEDSENAQALALRGALRLQGGDRKELEAAISDFESVLARMPDNPVLRFNLAEAYRAYGNTDRAIVEYQETIRRRPDYLMPRYGLAELHLSGADYAKAVAVAEEILAISPDNLRARLIRCNAWIGLGERDQARTALVEILKEAPNARDPLYHLARLEFLEGRYDRAEAGFRALYEGRPPDDRGLLGLVDVNLARGRTKQALQMLQQRVDQEPDHLGLRIALGRAADKAGDFELAAREFDFVLAKRPEDGTVHGLLGEVYFRGKRFAESERHFRRANELSPNNPIPFLYLGIMLEGRGELQAAVTYYERVIELSPDNPVALNNLAYILAETTADLDRALTLAQRARGKVPDDLDVADTLGWIYIKKNLAASAIPILEDLVTKRPKHVTWRYHLAMALYQKGDTDRARKELEIALRNNPSKEEESKIRQLLARAGT